MGTIIEMVFLGQFIVFLGIMVWLLYDTIQSAFEQFVNINITLILVQWTLSLIMFGVGMVAFLTDVNEILYSYLIALQAALLGIITLLLIVNVIALFSRGAIKPVQSYNALESRANAKT